jgi:acetoacetyl-CoA synthetase
VWDWCGVVGEAGPTDYAAGDRFWEASFLPDAQLNVAENLLADRADAAEDAIIACREGGQERTISWPDLRWDVAAFAAVRSAAGSPRWPPPSSSGSSTPIR